MKKVKITILKTTLDKELAAEYGIDGMTAWRYGVLASFSWYLSL